MITIRTAGLHDIDVIHTLAHRTWRIAYKEMISPEQMEYMLNMMYSHDSLHYQIEEQGHIFLIAYDDDVPVGFAAYFPKYDISPAIIRLDKLYVLTDQHGKGIGKKLIDHIISVIKPLGAALLELTVNRNNPSLTFYQKMGFKIIKEIDHPIGEGFFMNDYVMQKELSEP
jgi:ribosomal protein S18 acetylase RimI-like enzyme